MHEVENGSIPKDEVTGLQAFDDLDPVSAVSELALLPPEEPTPAPMSQQVQPRAASIPPPTPGAARSVPPPAPRHSAAPKGASVPPPAPRHSVAPQGASVPPPAPRMSAASQASAPPPPPHSVAPTVPGTVPRPSSIPAPHAEPTMQLSALDELGDDEQFDVPPETSPEIDAEGLSLDAPQAQAETADAAREASGIQSAELRAAEDTELDVPLDAAGTAATLDMDWDDDDVETRQALPLSDYEDEDDQPTQVTHNPLTAVEGQPSPFPTGDAVLGAAVASAAPAPVAQGGYPQLQQAQLPTAVDMKSGTRPLLPMAIGAALIAVLLGWFAFAGTEPAAATLQVSPPDAKVVLDGAAIEGSSPFTLLDLDPEMEHTLQLSREGFEPQSVTFRVEDGETRALPAVSLTEKPRDTGFAIGSQPAGLQVLLDGEPTGQVTPARITGVAPGMHAVAIEPAPGFAPYEVKVFVSDGQVLELPAATLAKSTAAPAEQAEAEAAQDEAPAEEAPAVAAANDDPGASARREARRERRRARRAERRRARASAASRPKAPKAAPAKGQGLLRVNTRPWSRVFVDGKLIGNTPQFNIKLSPGKHRVKFVNPQMGLKKTVVVRVGAGQTVTKVVNLIE